MSDQDFGLVVRSRVAQKPTYSEYLHDLRWDFWFSCAYCSMTEVEARGFGFEIDHYLPVSHRPDLSARYDNLMYACHPCNSRKSNHFSPELAAKGYRFVRPDQDRMDDHFDVDGLRVRGTSPPGIATEKVLDLNRHALLRIREIREKSASSKQQMLMGLRALRNLKLDLFPVDIRHRIVGLKADAEAQGKRIADRAGGVLDDLLREMNRSPLLDAAPDANAASAERRRYLQSINSHAPASSAPPQKKLMAKSKLKKLK